MTTSQWDIISNRIPLLRGALKEGNLILGIQPRLSMSDPQWHDDCQHCHHQSIIMMVTEDQGIEMCAFCLLSFLDVKFDHGGRGWPMSTYVFRMQNKWSVKVTFLEILLAHHKSFSLTRVVRPLIKCFSSFSARFYDFLQSSHGTHFDSPSFYLLQSSKGI